ncbi:MAG: DUF5686 and carboxypeptidase regulatory-like domain-containing protein [Saprospiraceae bacterium]
MRIQPITFLVSCWFSVLLSSAAIAQGIEGKVLDQNGSAVPYANIFVEEAQTGTSSDADGDFLLRLPSKGDYRVIVSALGYTSTVDTIILGDKVEARNFQLVFSSEALDEIVVVASKRDPAYAIMRGASERRKANLRSVGSYRAQVYLKAREDIDRRKKKKKDRKPFFSVSSGDDDLNPLEDDPFAEQLAVQNRINDSLMNSLNLIERQLVLNFQAPTDYKEERLASKVYGTDDGLFVPLFGDGDFNFYRSQVDFGSLTENLLISPLAPAAVLSYKFKLVAEVEEDEGLVYEINVTPRKKGNATLAGKVFINADDFTINRLDVVLPKGALKQFDAFRYEQSYTLVADSFWLPSRQVFNYETKVGKRQTYSGQTTIRFDDYELAYVFPEKFFRGELATTSAEAYERDTTYWKSARIEPLAVDEQKVVFLRDSIFARVNSVEYKDSVEAAYNKIQPLDIIWDGVGFRDHRTQENIYFGSLPSWLEYNIIGGWRVGPFVSYNKRLKTGQRFSTSINSSIGVRNKDVQGSLYGSFLYNPHKLAFVSARFGREFEAINDFDAIVNLLSRSNYILTDRYSLYHRRELFNGFYLSTDIGFSARKPIPELNTETFFSELLEEEPPIDFEPYEALITELRVEFTPQQQYLTEPLQKVVLGSKWPTIGLLYRKGWNGPIGSDIDFDYLQLSLKQRLQLGAIGNLNYNVEVGEFISSKDLRFVDIRRFPQSNPIWFWEPLRTFQLLDTALTAVKPFVDFHLVHHFNGALINNLPIIKLSRIEVVAGGGLMFLSDNSYRREEAFAGIERVFKLGARRRLRLGVYGVVGNSNNADRSQALKVSIDVIDTWKRDWSF